MDKETAYGALLEEINTGYAKMPESRFKDFIPFFFQKDRLSKEELEQLYDQWLGLAIDPRLPVNVMTEDGKEFLFQVPPLIYTAQILTGRNVAGTIKEWALRNEVSPLHGAKFAEVHVTDDLVLGTPPEEDVQAWREIMARYNIAGASSSSGGAVDLEEDGDDGW